MKVIATRAGFCGLKQREPGEHFEIPDLPQGVDGKPLAFSATWMEPEVPFMKVAPPEAKLHPLSHWQNFVKHLKRPVF